MSVEQPLAKASDQPSDASLVERTRRGDQAAFDILVRRHYRTAYIVALALLSDVMNAEDVCQDAFVKALERLDTCRMPERFASWLLQIVRNRAHNFRDYQRLRSGPPLEVTTAASPGGADQDAERSELRGRLEAALGELTAVQRQVVLLHDLDGWKHREIAQRLELSEGMSRQHLFAARKRLREHLGVTALEEYFHE